MAIKVVKEKIKLEEVKELAKEFYVSMIKGVVDIEKEIIALGGEFHMDANIVLMENGSDQSDVWGFNIQLEKTPEDWLEYTSLINIRPALGNLSIEISDQKLRDKMKAIIDTKIMLK